MAIHVLGIRHHGPGSAKSMLKAIHTLQPDAIVIEAPLEMDSVWKYANHEGIKPPVAVLVYNPQELQQASYYPFVDYSPEWQAVQYALEREVAIFSMDLPQSIRFAQEKEQAQHPATLFEAPKTEDADLSKRIAADPLGYLAELAGYEDRERWWEQMFEIHDNEEAIFEQIATLMTELRDAVKHHDDPDTLLREAYMRKTIRAAAKKHETVVVVCGAWHVPAINDLKKYKASNDNKLLRGLKKTKTVATWIPWTMSRIAYQSGYGAGVVSPAWYQFLYDAPQEAAIQWLTSAAVLMRKKDWVVSSAHIIEATRLANTLATLRGLPVPGINELWESAVTVIGGGDDAQLQFIKDALIIGDKIGDIPPSVPTVPIQKDIEKQAKSLRIKKTAEKVWLKATSKKPMGGLDLRQEHDRKQSEFLHRLNLLNIKWGYQGGGTGQEKGTMREYWELQWQPEMSIAIIEAGMWGNTLAEASNNYTMNRMKDTQSLAQLADLFQKVLYANLPNAMNMLIRRLQEVAAMTTDIELLLQALSPLVHIWRYGDVRDTDVSMVKQLVWELVPRICIGLPSACAALDENASRMYLSYISNAQTHLNLLNNEELSAQWYNTLEILSTSPAVHPLLMGLSNRLLFDAQVQDVHLTERNMRLALSLASDTLESAAWIEGFLQGSGLLLLHHAQLWDLMNSWVAQLPSDSFPNLLPALRRTFAKFSQTERAKMLQVALKGHQANKKIGGNSRWDEGRIKTLSPLLSKLLG